MEFEKAIEYRELLNSVKQVAQKQKITSSGREDRDIVAMARAMEDVVVQVFFIRGRKDDRQGPFYIQAGMAEEKGEIISGFVKQFYAGTPFIPREVWLQYPIEDEEIISQWLSQKKGQKVKLVVPQKGDKERLVELAARNAALVLTQDEEKIKQGRTAYHRCHEPGGKLDRVRRDPQSGSIRYFQYQWCRVGRFYGGL